MKRNAIEKLAEWKNAESGLPFFLFGMRGCGKTWLANEFAQNFYEGNALYFCLEHNSAMKQRATQFCLSDGEKELSSFFSAVFEVPKELIGNFLIILDEVTSDAAIWSYIRRELLKLPENKLSPILLISSHMCDDSEDLPLYGSTRLYPLRFDEYLGAIGSAWYADIIQGHFQTGRQVPGIVHEELLGLLEDYLLTGGMPQAVNEFLSTGTMVNLPEIHAQLIGRILYDINAKYEEGTALRMRQLLHVLPEQLFKANQKFQFRLIRRGATYNLYRDAICALQQDSLVLRCNKKILTASNSQESLPVSVTEEENHFKLFPSDVGMFCSMTGKNPNTEENDKSILECYLMQTLCTNGFTPFFWESASQAHVDFMLQQNGRIIPIELRTDSSSRNKSLGVFRKQYEIPYAYRLSYKNFDYSEECHQIPYYAVFCLNRM